jgi:hypothetical protein
MASHKDELKPSCWHSLYEVLGRKPVNATSYDRNTLLSTRTEHTECQAFSPVVRIGYNRPLTRKRVLPAPFGSNGEDTLALRDSEWREPIRTKGQTL